MGIKEGPTDMKITSKTKNSISIDEKYFATITKIYWRHFNFTKSRTMETKFSFGK